MKIVLGGTQFGMNYGFKTKNKISIKEISIIEKIVLKANIQHIDTAPSYGSSERVIGSCKLKKLKIFTKLKLENLKKQNSNEIEKKIYQSIQQSKKNLKVKKIFGLFVHDSRNLTGDKGKLVLNILKKLKKNKEFKYIGLSIYEVSELKKIWKMWQPDIVQFPFNVLDQRFLRDNFFKVLKKNKVKICVRSAFLQGLLLSDPNSIKMQINNNTLLKFHNWCLKKKIPKEQACINFVKQYDKDIDYLVLGFNSSKHLNENLQFFSNKKIAIPNYFFDNQTKLIDPRKW